MTGQLAEELVKALVERSTAESGVPELVADEVVLHQIATLFEGSDGE